MNLNDLVKETHYFNLEIKWKISNESILNVGLILRNKAKE